MTDWFNPIDYKEYLSDVIGVVEATHFEKHMLWQENEMSKRYKWEDDRMGGPLVTAGVFGGMPVCIALQKSKIDGRTILFVEATSIVVHYGMITDWLERYLPETAFKEGYKTGEKYVNKVDAWNFHNVFR